jgi:hypothetical protein
MRVEVVSKDVGVKKNGAKMQATQKYSLARPRTKLRKRHLQTKKSCWVRGIELEFVNRAWADKNNSFCKFPNYMLESSLIIIIPGFSNYAH